MIQNKMKQPTRKRYKIKAEFWDRWDPVARIIGVPTLTQMIIYYISACNKKEAQREAERLADKQKSPSIYEQIKFTKPQIVRM